MTDTVHVLTFELYGEAFALPVLDVREILHPLPLLPMPQAPGFVEGMVHLRGQIIPVLDLRKCFGLEAAEATPTQRLIVADFGHGITMGLLVDAVMGMERVPAEAMLPPPAPVEGSSGAGYIKGISTHAGKTLIHIDIRQVFADPPIDAAA